MAPRSRCSLYLDQPIAPRLASGDVFIAVFAAAAIFINSIEAHLQTAFKSFMPLAQTERKDDVLDSTAAKGN